MNPDPTARLMARLGQLVKRASALDPASPDLLDLRAVRALRDALTADVPTRLQEIDQELADLEQERKDLMAYHRAVAAVVAVALSTQVDPAQDGPK